MEGLWTSKTINVSLMGHLLFHFKATCKRESDNILKASFSQLLEEHIPS